MSAYKCILHALYALTSFSRCLNEDVEYLSTKMLSLCFPVQNGICALCKPVSINFIDMNVSVCIESYYIFRQFYFCQVCALPPPPTAVLWAGLLEALAQPPRQAVAVGSRRPVRELSGS